MKRSTKFSLLAGAVLVFGVVVASAMLAVPSAPQTAKIQLTTVAPTPVVAVLGQSTTNLQKQRPVAPLQVATLQVSNLYCASCPYMIRQTLEGTKGVVKAEVSYRDKIAVVTFDGSKSTATQLAAIVSELGFPTIVRK